MKVLHIVSWYSDYREKELTTGIFHNEQVKAFQSYCDVAIWYPFDKIIASEMMAEEEWGVFTFRTRWKYGNIKKINVALKAFKKIKQTFEPDIIHAHVANQAGMVSIAIGMRYHIPVIITEHTPVEMMGMENVLRKLKYSLIYGFSQRNLCVSDDLRNRLSKIFPHCSFNTIYNGVSDPQKILNKSPFHKKYRVDGRINIVIVAMFYDKDIKGFQYLLPALKSVNELRQKKVVLHICGGGKYLEYYKKLSREIDVYYDCIFYGNCEKQKIFDIVSQMDFGISASLFESAGVSIEEMLMLGKPVVVTKSGGVSSLVSEDNAIIVDTRSIEELVRGINIMSSCYEEYDCMKIRTAALKKFEMENIIGKYFELYKQLV